MKKSLVTTCSLSVLLLVGCSNDPPIDKNPTHDLSVVNPDDKDLSANNGDLAGTGDMARFPVGDGGCYSGEVCGNGLDDDCNGLSDDGCACSLGTTQPCWDGPDAIEEGACGKGTQTCVANGEFAAWGACTGAVHPSAEICDGLDNDCDGSTDEGLMRDCYSGANGTRDVGVCRGGTETCIAGSWSSCVGEVTPGQELCADSTDDNCDGQLNEGCNVCSPQAAVFNIPAGTTGGPSCITTGGGTCEGTIYCDGGGTCYTTPPGGCGGSAHCATLKCNDGTYTHLQYCTVYGSCGGGGITITNWSW